MVWARASHVEGTLKRLACERNRKEACVATAQEGQRGWPEVGRDSPWRALLDMGGVWVSF